MSRPRIHGFFAASRRSPLGLVLFATVGVGFCSGPAHAQAIAIDPVDDRPVDAAHPLSENYATADLVVIPTPPAVREGLRLRAPALAALMTMVEAAREDSVELRVVSGYRSFARQRVLHRSAIVRHGPDQRWVAPAGESEHQLGTTIDAADAALLHVLEPSFAQTREGQWIARHCERFGFVISYDDSTAAAKGYEPEPWHLRFVGNPAIETSVQEEAP